MTKHYTINKQGEISDLKPLPEEDKYTGIKFTKTYLMIRLTMLNKLALLMIILMAASFIYAILSMPRDFRNGVYPRIEQIQSTQDGLREELDNTNRKNKIRDIEIRRHEEMLYATTH